MKITKLNYRITKRACFVGFIVQAIVNNYAPLLFAYFHRSNGIPLSRIALLVALNFGVQLGVDLISVFFVDKISYRVTITIAHVFSAVGLLFMAVMPSFIANMYLTLAIAVILYAIGGGLLEVILSPIMNACPAEDKGASMSLLHSFYCWGYVGVVLLSTIFFSVFGIQRWRILAAMWATIPMGNLFIFLKAPMPPMAEKKQTGIHGCLRNNNLGICFFLIFCAGACENVISQWISAFAEEVLTVSKTVGDMIGPMFLATMMGVTRSLYGKYGDKISLRTFLLFSSILCAVSYALISYSVVPAIIIIGFGICGLSTGILWPGILSIAAESIPKGGTAMFALLALGGDLGCIGGPSTIGVLSDLLGGNLSQGFRYAIVFPILLIGGMLIFRRMRKRQIS